MKDYRRNTGYGSLLFLAAAFASKYYRGPGAAFSSAYLGDLFIVGCLYAWLGFFCIRLRPLMKAGAVGLFATLVELFQKTGIPASWGLPQPFTFVAGTAYDAKDFIFYFLGLVLAWGIDVRLRKHAQDV
jgi:hypothetical protein